MNDRRIKKSPGWSIIEVDKVMYSFIMGEGLNGVTEEANEKLVEIMSRIRIEGGYIPEVGSVLHDIEEEEKENAVSMHSEKLAVAFGISRLCRGSIIRVVKNLRVCRDCHTAMKLISEPESSFDLYGDDLLYEIPGAVGLVFKEKYLSRSRIPVGTSDSITLLAVPSV
ncbi:hypothetical protein IFM89_031292 [Coptis chinensis]|uniref:DYW domain-containing protein n=1 Tax=Coptis chinensis TaxID=261450 RepID=A0A835IW01_9MAGN|nr:hypothetical protein IFM89_031292 [Coptis chinensis]